MLVKVIEECGYHQALIGIGLSFGLTSGYNDWVEVPQEIKAKLHYVAFKLSKKGGGEDKFLRQISVWLDINAPLYWWKEADTYKVGTTAQSESTMHTITHSEFKTEQFERPSSSAEASCLYRTIETLNAMREKYLEQKEEQPEKAKWLWYGLIRLLPSSWLQRRIWSANYATLRNITMQRKGHKLQEWADFLFTVKSQVCHPEFLED